MDVNKLINLSMQLIRFGITTNFWTFDDYYYLNYDMDDYIKLSSCSLSWGMWNKLIYKSISYRKYLASFRPLAEPMKLQINNCLIYQYDFLIACYIYIYVGMNAM